MSESRSIRPLVFAAHGTRDPRGQATVAELCELVAARLPGVEVRLGWVDVIEPTLESVMVDYAVLVPVFLGTGFHVRFDVPQAAALANGVIITGALGPAPEVLTAVRERLMESSDRPDAVVLGAAGSSDPLSRAEASAAAALLENGLGIPVLVGFLSAAEPSVIDAVKQLRAEGRRRVAIASYLLAPGFFQDKLRHCGADVVSSPIGAHPDLADMIAERYRRAASSDTAA